jgi:hypothetical protein
MSHKNLYSSRSIRFRVLLCVLVVPALAASLSHAFTPDTTAQAGDARSGSGDAQPHAEFARQLSPSVNLVVSNAAPIASTFQFSRANYETDEDAVGGLSGFTITRTGDLSGTATVNYATGGGTATPGSDYTPVSGTLTFQPGQSEKTIPVFVIKDCLYDGETSETIGLTLSGVTGDATLGAQATATITIRDTNGRPSVLPGYLRIREGDSGTTTAQYAVRLSCASIETVSVSYATADGAAKADSDYVAASGTLTFQPGETEKTFPLRIRGDTVAEDNEWLLIKYSNFVNVGFINGDGYIELLDDERQSIQFDETGILRVNEGDGRATVTVTRFGPATGAASVDYSTHDEFDLFPCNVGNFSFASARCDYATTSGRLVFAPGENRKTITVPLVDDGHVEQVEQLKVQLTSPSGASLGLSYVTTLRITDNDAPGQPNPIDAHAFFVRQHYLDFLAREPDAGELAAWTGVLGGCADPFNKDAGSPSAQCDRIHVSSSFFRATEFELKGYFVYRFYRVAFDRRPTYVEFTADMGRIAGQTPEEVYDNRRAFGDAWMLRPESANLYGAKTDAGFVDSLLGRYGLTIINTPDPANPEGHALVRLTRDELVAALDARPQRLTRAQVLRAVVESGEIDAVEYNGAFVAMQYYGYLRRAPEQAGYDAWLQVITGGDGYRVMVNGFMNSTEYRLRFGK